jgi:hypothetical protein
MLLIREAFLRGLSTRQVGRAVAILTNEVVSAQTVSKQSRSLDRLVKAFHQARLRDEWAYSVPGRRELAGGAPQRVTTRADAGRLRGTSGRWKRAAGLLARYGLEPGSLGESVTRSLPAWAAGK